MQSFRNITKRFDTKAPLRGHSDMVWLKLVCVLKRDGKLRLTMPRGKYRQTPVNNDRDFCPVRARNADGPKVKNDLTFCNGYLRKLIQDYDKQRKKEKKGRLWDTSKHNSSH